MTVDEAKPIQLMALKELCHALTSYHVRPSQQKIQEMILRCMAVMAKSQAAIVVQGHPLAVQLVKMLLEGSKHSDLNIATTCLEVRSPKPS